MLPGGPELAPAIRLMTNFVLRQLRAATSGLPSAIAASVLLSSAILAEEVPQTSLRLTFDALQQVILHDDSSTLLGGHGMSQLRWRLHVSDLLRRQSTSDGCYAALQRTAACMQVRQ